MVPSIRHLASTTSLTSPQYLIFFITGNPGLIAYYNTFLSTLHTLLESSTPSLNPPPAFHIYGQSLAGFEDVDDDISTPATTTQPYGLTEQISQIYTALKSQAIPLGPRKGEPYDGVFLMGHSVGSYILLELLGRIRKETDDVDSAPVPKIRAGILLFPTVTHIAQSPSGLKFSALACLPDFARRAHGIAKALLWPVPRSVLGWVVGVVMGMPTDAAGVTMRFLESRRGIWQALHMAKDEMEMITEDQWDEDIWGVEHPDDDFKGEIPKLIFYFGQNDHWVADHTRDALIATRAQDERQTQASKPKMLIDQDGIPHGFCIKHSEIVAEKVKVWIEEMVNYN